MGTQSVSQILKKLRDSQEARGTFSAKFNIALPDTLVFHGTSEKIENFQTNISLGGANENKEEALVYASNEPDYAIFLGLIELQEGGSASVTCENGEVKKSVTVGFVNGDSKRNEGYIYVLDAKDFIAHDNSEFTSDQSDLLPLFSVKVGINDLESPIVIN